MLTELFKYLLGFFIQTADSCDVTVVRRYETPCGYNGEVYVNGKQLGVSCDAFLGAVEVFRHPLEIGYERGKRILRTDCLTITNGDFTAKVAPNYCLIGSLEPKENEAILSRLIDAVKGFKYIRLTVLNRLLVEN